MNKEVRFNKEPILDVQRHHKPTRSPWANKSLSRTRVNHQAWRNASLTERRSGVWGLIPLKPLLRKHQKFRKSPDWKRLLPCPYCEKVHLRVKIRRQENIPSTEQQNPHVKNYNLLLQKVVVGALCMLGTLPSVLLGERNRYIFPSNLPKRFEVVFRFFSQNFPLGWVSLYRRVMKRTAGRQWNRISIGIFGSTCYGFPGFSSVSLNKSCSLWQISFPLHKWDDKVDLDR